MNNFNEPLSLEWHDNDSHSYGFIIIDSTGKTVADDGSACGEYNREMTEESAHRIIACINACAGIPDDKLFIISNAGKILAQRDKLLAALEEMTNGGDNVCGFDDPCDCRFCRSRRIIAEIKAGK